MAGKALAKIPPKNLAVPREEEDWEKKLREKAKAARAAETLGVPRISHDSGVLMIDGKRLEGNRVSVVPLGIVYAKQWFENDYVKGVAATPGCYAFGRDGDKGLIPHQQVPKKQADACDGCEHNKFNTAKVGRGKRCSDVRRILVLLAADLQKDGDEEVNKAIAKAQHYQITIPSGSLKPFGEYLAGLRGLTPHDAMEETITEITTEANPGRAYTVNLTYRDTVPRQAMPALVKRGEAVWDLLTQPFPVIEPDEPKAPVKGQGKRR